MNWRRIVSSAALWAVIYNLVWGFAWFGFMREEWFQASAAIRRPMPWTAEVWFIWVVLTLAIATAIMAYAASHSRTTLRSSLLASLSVGVLFLVGMTAWGISSSLQLRILVLDGSVNIFGMLLAAAIGAWSLGESEQ